jgi:GH15 family glucan-1,4-alpha-glucosidase
MRASVDLAVIGNCEVAALVSPAGELVWACLPRPDGDPVFCALLEPDGGDGESGIFAVDLLNGGGRTQAYVRNTAIVATVLGDAFGNIVRITDFCPRFRDRGRMFRPMMFVRLVEPLGGRPQIRIRLAPCSDYGLPAPEPVVGSHHLSFRSASTPYRVTTDASMTALVERRPFALDGPVAFIIGPDETIPEAPLGLARSLLDATRQYWEEWVRALALPFDWQVAVIRAAITLKLSTYEDSGAVLAALTTSVPEAPDTGRNWDYRYCWLRDSYFVVQALNRLGATRTMEGYLRYINNIVGQTPAQDLQPVYGIGGEAQLEERVTAALAGYRRMGPVRIGNAAYLQRQNDVYGALVLAASQLFYDARLAVPGDAALFAALERLGERAVAAAGSPDSGPWELRGRADVHTFSAVMCWAACDRLARIAQRLALPDRSARWKERAASIASRTLSAAWSDARRSFVATFGGTGLDATLLLLPELGIVSGSDPRFLCTLRAIEAELLVDDLLFRYREPDDFGVPKFAFTSCSFWYVNALAAAGRAGEAREIFERVLARTNAVGLLAEHIDPASGEHWGNFPQTYCMVGIISSALRISRPWEEAL